MGVVAAVLSLAQMPRKIRGSVADVRNVAPAAASLPVRLRDLGFLDGEEVEVLTAGRRGGPIAVRIGGSTFALRAQEADCVLVRRLQA